MVVADDGRQQGPARIKDVAARAGVSLKTVTNVVHQRPYVRDETQTVFLPLSKNWTIGPHSQGASSRAVVAT